MKNIKCILIGLIPISIAAGIIYLIMTFQYIALAVVILFVAWIIGKDITKYDD